MSNMSRHLAWAGVAILGAFALATVALANGEAISALWIVVAAVAVYLVAYRYYSLFIATKVMQLDPTRQTPAVETTTTAWTTCRPTSTCCSATTSPPSPAPGRWSGRCWPRRWATCPACCGSWPAWCWPARCRTSWCCSSPPAATAARWASWSSEEMGTVPGVIALFGAFLIMIIILAVLALIVVKALAETARGARSPSPRPFPIALFMGVYMRFIRPGRHRRGLDHRLRAADAGHRRRPVGA